MEWKLIMHKSPMEIICFLKVYIYVLRGKYTKIGCGEVDQ